MDNRWALLKLRKAKIRFYGGLIIILFDSIFIVAGISSQQSFPIIFGTILVCYGILYGISGIVLWHKYAPKIVTEEPRYYTPSVGLKKNNLDILYFRAEECLSRGQFKDAVEIFDRTLVLESNFPAAWFGLARAWKYLQDYQEMLDAAREGLNIKPLDTEGLLLFGEACIHLKEYIKARQALIACLKVEFNNPVARQLLGDLEDRIKLYLT